MSYSSTDDGLTWNADSIGLPINCNYYGSATNGSNIFACGDYGVYLNKNNGSGWVNISNDLPKVTYYALDVNGTYIYAGSSCTGVWRRPLSDFVGIKERNK